MSSITLQYLGCLEAFVVRKFWIWLVAKDITPELQLEKVA
jgi:hypothetical protein